MEVIYDDKGMEYRGAHPRPRGKHNPRVWEYEPGRWACLCTCGYSLLKATEAAAREAEHGHATTGGGK